MTNPADTDGGAATGAAGCWRRIGVWGRETPRCERLATLLHCHNCEVYTQAARQGQTQPPDKRWRDDWAAEYRLAGATGPRERGESMLEFCVAGLHCALPTRSIDAAGPRLVPRGLPHRRDRVVHALVHMQGSLHLHADLARLLVTGGAALAAPGGAPASPRTLLIGRAPQGYAIGVDDVPGLFALTVDTLLPLPASLAGERTPWLRGVVQRAGRTVTVLDDAALLARLAADLH